MGPRTDPCGTPALMSCGVDDVHFRSTVDLKGLNQYCRSEKSPVPSRYLLILSFTNDSNILLMIGRRLMG